MKASSFVWALTALATTSVSALDFDWLTTAGNNQTWNNRSVWRVNGEVPERTPCQADDSAYISYGGNDLSRMAFKIWFPSSNYYAVDSVHELEFGSLACEAGLHPQLSFYTFSDRYSGFGQTITVSDPDGFGGFWTSETGRGKLVLKATASHTPFVKYFDTWGYMAIEVPDAGTAAEVGSLVRSGALKKQGAGTLTVDNAAGADSRIYVDDGTLVLNGVAENALEPKLPSGSVLHLDATRIADSDTSEESYGSGKKRTIVTTWRDCEGNAVWCSVPTSPRSGDSYIGTARAPYLATETSTTGLPLLDFGLPMTCATEDAPSNCCFQLSTAISAKEVFYVAQNTVPAGDAAESSGSLLGGMWDLNLMGGGRTAVFGYYASDAAMRADITINGCPGSNRKTFPTRFNGADLGSLSVVSVKLPSAQVFNTIASERNMVNGTGGWRVGEILVYDKDLTDDERAEAVRFLMKKWHRDYVDKDVGELVVHADTAAIEVPAGRVARVGNLSAHGCGKIVKQGDGTLLADGITQTNVVVEVKGGKIELVASAIPANAPAVSPMLWLDATNTASFVCEGGDTSKIVRWNDCRGASDCYAEIPPSDAGTSLPAGRYPWLIKGQTPTGRDAVSFGVGGNASWMWLQPRDRVDSYSGFVVYRVNKYPQSHTYPLGSSGNDLLRGDAQLVNSPYSTPNGRTPRWTLDGRAIDPWFSDYEGTHNTFAWRVQAYSGTLDKIRGDLLATYSTNDIAYAGNVDLAEVILYDRPLTLDEVRATEAYLMAKWLGKPHPEAEPQVREYAFGPDVEVTVGNSNAGTTRVLPRISGGNGSLTADGAGSVVIAETDGGVGTNEVNVTAGSLKVAYPVKEISVYDTGAALHFDASDLSSFEFGVMPNGDGTVTTNVLSWRDQLNPDLLAKSDWQAKPARSAGKIYADPTFKAVTMPNGRVVPVVDFGSRNSTENAAALTFYKGSQWAMNNATEVFAVMADQRANDRTSDYLEIIGSDWNANFIRNGDCGLLSRYASDYDNGNKDMVSVDGVQQAATYALPAGFHVVSYRPKIVNNAIGCLGRDRNSVAGGGKIAEVLAFTTELTDAQRTGIIQALTKKWLQYADDPVGVKSISLSNGAAFGVGDGKKVVTGALTVSGASSLTCGELELTGGSSLTIDIAADGTVGSLAVSGPVTFDGAVDVSFAVANVKALEAGTYTVLTAPSLEGFDAALWSVDDSPFNGRRFVRFYQDGNAIKMSVTKSGLSIILK